MTVERKDVRLAAAADQSRLDRLEELILLLYGFSEPGRARRGRVQWVNPMEGGWAERAGQLALEIQNERKNQQ